ncbi:interferon alpha/beta receptor 1b-like isoform X2 [Echeneis naucrates]|uniref:Interferon alpha/beta receptor 1b-like n=1 Tax=Echeneis naucrates TaxID=173247 RepID=A0A665W688_ECHNA|nr:interferon alpha/beta receptor 1b-like isoform X2 [Echeneis naucrates]
MSALLKVYLLFWILKNIVGFNFTAVRSSVGVLENLPPPHKLIMITLNTNYTLSWTWNQLDTESLDVSFTTQYVGKYELKYKRKIPNWSIACEGTAHRSCDLTKLDLHHLGTYMLRVRANVNGHHSDWAELEFFPDRDADLGPPSKVHLIPAENNLDVVISDPLTSTNSTMKDLLGDLYYHILYWERSADSQPIRTQTFNSSANVVTLPNLKAWTWYCVRVQSRTEYYLKRSRFTPPQCLQTEGNTPWWQVVLCFIGSLITCFLVIMLLVYSTVWCYKTLKGVLYPSNQLPSHFLRYQCDSPGSDIPRLLTPDSQSELLCDNVTICPEPVVLEIRSPPAVPSSPPGLEPDSRHSRQDSGSSGDSGVYSSGGSSNLQPSSHVSKGVPKLWKGPFDFEQTLFELWLIGPECHRHHNYLL